MGVVVLIFLLVFGINIVITKNVSESFEGSILDNKIFYRICLIPPIGIITYALFTIFVVFVMLLVSIKEIWK